MVIPVFGYSLSLYGYSLSRIAYPNRLNDQNIWEAGTPQKLRGHFWTNVGLLQCIHVYGTGMAASQNAQAHRLCSLPVWNPGYSVWRAGINLSSMSSSWNQSTGGLEGPASRSTVSV